MTHEQMITELQERVEALEKLLAQIEEKQSKSIESANENFRALPDIFNQLQQNQLLNLQTLEGSIDKELGSLEERLKEDLEQSIAKLSQKSDHITDLHKQALEKASERSFSDYQSRLTQNQAKWAGIFTVLTSIILVTVFVAAAQMAQISVMDVMQARYENLKLYIDSRVESIKLSPDRSLKRD